jgi:protease-4
LLQQRLLGKPPLSLVELELAFRRIADDGRVKGVILHLRDLAMPLADLQTLRDSLRRLRARGKRVLCYAQRYEMSNYYVATAADEILLLPGGGVAITGLVQQQVFLREALDTIGLQADAVAISPYKSAADTLTRPDPSPESAAMTNWLLDSRYDVLLSDMAQARQLDRAAAHAMIDNAPYTDQEAHAQGYIDGLTSEEGMYAYLKTEHIVTWEQADSLVPLRVPVMSDRYVVVLPVSGLIVEGESGSPPVDIPLPLVGGERMGDLTVVQQVRAIMQDESAAAVVLWIDSGGGSAAASEAMASALDELAKTRPVVACLNNVAASGGYYIATPADWIVAQSGTITGSIGVFGMKLINTEALRKLRFNPYTYLRGTNASMFTTIEPFNATQREKMKAYIERIYTMFVERVAVARKMKPDQVNAVSEGREWTGKQALENGLVDELGGLYEAIKKARELANLDAEDAVVLWRGKGKPLPAQLADQMNPAAALRYWQQNIEAIANGAAQMLMPSEWK